MTVFAKIGQLFLERAINEAHEASLDADHSNVNHVLTLFSPAARDLQLSAEKRAQLIQLRTQLNEIDTTSPNDDTRMLTQFLTLLTTSQSTIADLARRRQHSEGQTGKALLSAQALIQSIYSQLMEAQLLNIDTPKPYPPLLTFQYFSAQYFAEKIFSEQRVNLLQSWTSDPGITPFRERAQQRGRLIKEALTQCQIDLATLDIKNRDYADAVKRHVTKNIQDLLRNEIISRRHYGELANAVWTSLNSVGITNQDDQLLNHCMHQALTAIQTTPTQQQDEWADPQLDEEYAEVRRHERILAHQHERNRFELFEAETRNQVRIKYEESLASLVQTLRTEL